VKNNCSNARNTWVSAGLCKTKWQLADLFLNERRVLEENARQTPHIKQQEAGKIYKNQAI
jgi:hypothetical protein